MMMAIAGIATALACLATHHSKIGCGHSRLPLTFNVVDERDGRPVVGAKFELITDYGRPPDVSEISGNNGSVATIVEAGHTSYRGPFFRRYRVFSYCYALRIEAEGYQREEGMLMDYMKNPVYRSDRVPHPSIAIKLKRSPGVKFCNR
jgi:hypothetical protein